MKLLIWRFCLPTSEVELPILAPMMMMDCGELAV